MDTMAYSACITQGNWLRLEDTIGKLEAEGWDELYFPVMDGQFCPRFTVGASLLRAAKQAANLPCAAHLLTMTPEQYIDQFAEAGCDTIIVPVETCNHSQRTLGRIRDAGVKPGISLNPTTPLIKLDYLLDYVDRVVMFVEEPGYVPRRKVAGAEERVSLLRQNIQHRRLKTSIAAFGDFSPRDAALLQAAEAQMLIADTPGLHVAQGLAAFQKEVHAKYVAFQELA